MNSASSAVDLRVVQGKFFSIIENERGMALGNQLSSPMARMSRGLNWVPGAPKVET
ncbi:MAG: hypothetical protein K0R88_1724 [Solirubrobacterales bacterium]|jgi:hypothetical protein|nr:hypothetical protein [Solirubrobacterales bacterium]